MFRVMFRGGGGIMPDEALLVHVIDDDDAVRESLEALLLVAGYAVETHGSAEAYLARTDGVGGCLLLDLHMPGMGGLELMAELSRRGRPVPVVVLTAARDERLLSSARALGARAVLQKPVPEQQLLAALGAAGSGPR